MNVFKIFIKYWYVVLAFAVIGGLVGALTQDNKFESNASVMFKLGREHLYQPEFGNRQPIASTRSDMANAINTETHIMGSAEVLQAAVNEVGAERILSSGSDSNAEGLILSDQHAIELLSKELSIRAVEGTNVLKLSFSHESPEVARDTLNAIISSFMDYRKELLYSDSSLLLMKQKLEKNQNDLKTAEDELQVFSSKHNIYSYEDQMKSVTQQLIEGDRDRQNLEAEKSEVELQLQLATQRIANTAQSIPLFTDTATNAVVDDAKARLFELQVERNQLRGKYHDSSERVTQLESEIVEIKSFIDSQDQFTTRSERKGRNPAFDDLVSRKLELENQLDQIISRQQSLTILMSALEKKRNDLQALSVEYEKINSLVSVLRERQLVYLDEVDRAELAADVDKSVRSGARILQGASLPTDAAGITGRERIQLGATVGLLFSIALLMGINILNSLGWIPSFRTRAAHNTSGTSLKTVNGLSESNTTESNGGDKATHLDAPKGSSLTVLGKIAKA